MKGFTERARYLCLSVQLCGAYRDYRAPTLWANQSVARDGSIVSVMYYESPPSLTRPLPPRLLALVQRLAWPQDRQQQTRGTHGNLNQVQQVQWREAAVAASGRAEAGQGQGRELQPEPWGKYSPQFTAWIRGQAVSQTVHLPQFFFF